MSQPEDPFDDSDDPVEELLADCLAQPESDRAAALQRACEEHPQHGAELRARFEALSRLGLTELDRSPEDLPERLGEFRLLRRLGGGGMGVVYLALQESLGREVALKVVRPEQLFFSGARLRFQRETQAVARLQHPGIVPIYTVGEERRIPFFAMERVLGCTLAEVLAALGGRAPESLAGADLVPLVGREAQDGETPAPAALFQATWVNACLEICRQVAEALEHCHSRGILHRDVKPSNIMLTRDGRAMLLDFGLTSAEETERLTRTGFPVGTLHYMSPEQIRATRPDARTDGYSLGVTLYELLTLQAPYQGRDALEVQNAVLHGAPDPLRARNRRVSEDVQTVCLHAMESEPGRRYQTARELGEDLGRAAALHPIRARPPGTRRVIQRWAQRNRLLAAVLAAAVVVLAGMTAAWWVQQLRYTGQLRIQIAQEQKARHEVEIERQRSQEELDVTEGALEFLAELLQPNANSFAQGYDRVPTALELLERGEERLAEVNPRIRVRIEEAIGEIYAVTGRVDRAVALLDGSLAYYESLHDPLYDAICCRASLCLGSLQRRLGNVERADQLFQRAAALARSELERIKVENHQAALALARGQLDRAEELVQVSIARSTGVEDLGPQNRVGYQKTLCMDWLMLGQIQRERGSRDEARHSFETALEIQTQLLDPVHPDRGATLMNLAMLNLDSGRLEESEQRFQEALGILRQTWYRGDDFLPQCLWGHACLQQQRGDLDGAEASLAEALGLFGGDRSVTPAKGYCLAKLAEIRVQQGRSSEAAGCLEEALEVFADTPPGDCTVLGTTQCQLARVLARTEDAVLAAEHFREAAESQAECPGGADRAAQTYLEGVEVLVAAEEYDEAEELLAEALALAREELDPGHPARRVLLERKVRLDRARGQEEEARRAEEELAQLPR